VELPATEENVSTSGGLCGAWIDLVHERHPPKGIIHDMDSGVCPPHGDQEGSAHSPGNFVPTLALPKARPSPSNWPRLKWRETCFGNSRGGSMIRDQDQLRYGPGKSTAG